MIEIREMIVPHKYRNRRLRDAGSGSTYISVGANSGSSDGESGIFKLLTSDNGEKYAFTDLPIVTSRTMTFLGGPNPYIPSMFEEIPIDNKTITWQEGQLVASGGGGGGGLSKVTVKVGTTPYESVEGVVSLPAYPNLSNYVTTNTNQEITGVKTFQNDIVLRYGNSIYSDGKKLLWAVSNGNAVLNALGDTLFLGYENTAQVLVSCPFKVGDNNNPWLKVLPTGETQTKKLFVDKRIGEESAISLAIGDNDTGFDWSSDGVLTMKSDAKLIAWFNREIFRSEVGFSAGEDKDDAYGIYNCTRPAGYSALSYYAMVNTGMYPRAMGMQNGDIVFGIPNANKEIYDVWVRMSNGNLFVSGYTSWSSDARYKTIIENIELPLDKIANAPTIRYKWNKEGMSDETRAGGTAQYMEDVIPEVVKENDDFKSLDYATTAYIFAVQDARYIQALEKRVEELERKMNQPNILKRLYEKITLLISAAFGSMWKGGRNGDI